MPKMKYCKICSTETIGYSCQKCSKIVCRKCLITHVKVNDRTMQVCKNCLDEIRKEMK